MTWTHVPLDLRDAAAMLPILAEWADDHDTALARELREESATWTGAVDIPRLILVDLTATHDHMLASYRWVAPDALGWVAAHAVAPDYETMMALARMLGEMSVEEGQQFRAWKPVGAWGPLAYVAGLTPAETLAGIETGHLTADGLFTLMALRGWTLDPLLMQILTPTD